MFSFSGDFRVLGHFNAIGKVSSREQQFNNVRGVNCLNLTNVIIDGAVSSN